MAKTKSVFSIKLHNDLLKCLDVDILAANLFAATKPRALGRLLLLLFF